MNQNFSVKIHKEKVLVKVNLLIKTQQHLPTKKWSAGKEKLLVQPSV